MTFVFAKRFGDRIIMFADTKISDPAGVTRTSAERRMGNAVPGRLKVFPLGTNVSVGYAGKSGAALAAIRKLPSCRTYRAIDEVREMLRQASGEHDTDFLLVSHIGKTRLLKIQSGMVSADQDFHWIRHPAASEELIRSIEEQREAMRRQIDNGYMRDHRARELIRIRSEEILIHNAWSRLLLMSPDLLPGVGGIPICLEASAEAHYFPGAAGAYNPEPVTIDSEGRHYGADGEIEPRYGQWSYTLVSGPHSGVPVLGLWLQEAGVGFVYDPLKCEEAERVPEVDTTGLAAVVAQRSLERGRSRLGAEERGMAP